MGFEEGNEDGMGPGYREGKRAVDWMHWVACVVCFLDGEEREMGGVVGIGMSGVELLF